MTKKPKTDIPPNAQTSRSDSEDKSKADFLKVEYTSLLSLYTHTENAIFSTFNFYLTLLSAITAAMIVLVQINIANVTVALPSIIVLLILTTLVGIIIQDSIVNRNTDLFNYTLAVNLLKHRLFYKWPEEKAYVSYLHSSWARVSPVLKRRDMVERIHRRLWWLFPVDAHQLFISIVNSLALTAIVVIVTHLLSVGAVSPGRLIIGGTIMSIISFEINIFYARIKHERGIGKFVTAAGTEVTWIKETG